MSATDSLKVFAIASRTNVAGVAADDVDQEELRLLTGSILAPGYLPKAIDGTANPDAFKVRQDTGANMSIKVGSGVTKNDVMCLRGTVAGQGSYLVRLDAATRTIVVPAADGTNPARYGVFLVVNDTAYAGTAGRAYVDVVCIRGTPAGAPVTPGPLAAWSAYMLLWEFQLAAAAGAVTNTILDAGIDRRTASMVISGSAPGSMMAFAGATAPGGWLLCDGSAVSRSTFAPLFAAIGTTWGAGDGSTTFNVPDMRGRTPIGAGTGTGLTARALGVKLGEENHVLTTAEMPSHQHSIEPQGVALVNAGGALSVLQPGVWHTGLTGGDGGHNTMQPSAVVNWIIKA